MRHRLNWRVILVAALLVVLPSCAFGTRTTPPQATGSTTARTSSAVAYLIENNPDVQACITANVARLNEIQTNNELALQNSSIENSANLLSQAIFMKNWVTIYTINMEPLTMSAPCNFDDIAATIDARVSDENKAQLKALIDITPEITRYRNLVSDLAVFISSDEELDTYRTSLATTDDTTATQSVDISNAISELQAQRQDIEAQIAALEPQLSNVPTSEPASRVAIKALPQLNNVNTVATAMAQMNVQMISMSRQLEGLNEQAVAQSNYIALQSTAIALQSQRNDLLQQEVALQSSVLAQSSGSSGNKSSTFENRVMYHISFLFPLKVQTLQDYRTSTTDRINTLSTLVGANVSATPVVEN
ncbi:MAG: hypothetical protein ACO3F2_01555 [Roseiflexaceae bacterium]